MINVTEFDDNDAVPPTLQPYPAPYQARPAPEDARPYPPAA
jgi:hypothetical protein